MCGIAGLVSRQPDQLIGPMLQSIEHRGRDDEGVWVSEPFDDSGKRACLGHRRLAIIDPTPAGHEPMFSPDGRFALTFNGEIYNYRELRAQLRSLGHQFKTDSDAEVLLAVIDEWGWDGIKRLNGMFAFAVWDNRERTLTLVRDHVGIKPLYYAVVPEGFVFGSEIKALLVSKLISPHLNPEALHQFLTFLWAPDPNTLFTGVKTVPPGHYLQFKNNEVTLTQWWDVSFDVIDHHKSDEWWQERTLETLDRVVKMEMVADVPLGAFLSGGIDSSGIVAMMDRHSNDQKISTYTAGIKSEDLRYDIIPDDVRWARRVNEELKTDYHEILLQPSVADLLPKLVHHMEEPPIDRVNAGHLAKEHWTQDPVEGGGRIIGEVCHFIDFMQFLTGAPPVTVFAESVSAKSPKIVDADSVFITLRFADGSNGAIAYLSEGDKSLPKERIEIFGGGKSFLIDDFRKGKAAQDKGQRSQIQWICAAVLEGGPAPIDLNELTATTRATFRILDSLRERRPFEV